jgi:hypothetical protein
MKGSRERNVGSGARSAGSSAEPAGQPGKRTLVEDLGMNASAPQGVAPSGHDGEPAVARQGVDRAAVPSTEAPKASNAGVGASDKPAATYLIPFDRAPKSAPGERIILGAEFTDPSPASYQLVYTGVGGDFNAAASGTKTVTYPGLVRDNIDFYIDASWDKKTAVTVKLEVQKVSDKTVVQTENWSFSAKPYYPTTIKQTETADERALGSTYHYKVGPDRGNDGKDDYVGQTILEEFGLRSSNLKVADLKPDYAKTHGLTTDQAVTDHFFGTSSSNGTFTVWAGDAFSDVHSGSMPDKATFEAALVAMKEIYVDLPQTYSAQPGTPLGKFTIRRILKTDGTKKLKKWQTL